ncbi:MAG: 16S rRNA pseudouridine(516) synthase, partial [Verrucomicrobiales bacterium]
LRALIASGTVEVNGVTVLNGRASVGEFDRVAVAGEVLQDRRPIYVMMHKPASYVSATVDDEHPTVLDLIGDAFPGEDLHLAGRLDRSSTGLLLLTNDGAWSRALTLPGEEHAKVYLVETAEPIAEGTAEIFARGIYFGYEDITTGPAELEIVAERRGRLTIYEGKYHQVKRMFHAVGNRVVSLHRERIGKISLDPALAPGGWRELTEAEI